MKKARRDVRAQAVSNAYDRIVELEAHIQKMRDCIKAVNEGADYLLLVEFTEQADIEGNWNALVSYREFGGW